jgi:Tol biopolymer transport system component
MLVAADLWSLPVNAGSGTATGPLRQVTDDHGVNESPSVTADRTSLVYISKKSGVRDIWLRDLATGQENSITRFTKVGYRPTLSPDGNRLAYPSATREGQCIVVVTDLRSKSPDSTLKGCFNIWSWSPDGSSLAIYTPDENIRSVDIFKIDAEQRRPLLSHPSYSFFDAAFSPVGGWITFTAGPSALTSQIYVAPFRGSAIRESEWIPITREGGRNSAWSPDGGVLYFHSNRDGFPCIWSQKLDTARRPVGSPQTVQHFHSVSFGTYLMNPQDFHISVAKDRLLLNLTKETANLWVTANR